MANEVSCKVVGVFATSLKAKGLPLETMVVGTNIPLEKLLDKKERIDWADLCKVLDNLHPHFTDEERIEMGRRYMRAPSMRAGMLIARLLFQPMDFYRWMNKPREGHGNQMFSCVVPSHRELAPNHVQMELTVPEGFEPHWDFFLISAGNMEELPRLLGLPRSKVTLSKFPHGARFDVIVPLRTPILAKVWRVLTWPFTVRAAGKELKEAHENLLEKYEQLEAARLTLDIQATRLSTAHAVSDLIHGDLDLSRTATSIATALVEQAKFEWAAIEVATSGVTVEFGKASNEVTLERPLSTQSGPIGKLRVRAGAGADMKEREELLAFVEPTLAMALQNALTYRELSEYKTGLEKLVDERTADLRKAHDELELMVDELREAQAARQRFFGNISHEIRTPLALILLAASDIERRSGHALDERSKSGLGAVNDSAKKLVRLVDELLLLAAGQEDKLVLAQEPTDLAAMLKQIANAWRPAGEASGLEIASSGPARLVANVDPVAIERVVSNLMSNAVKYTKRGHVDLELAQTAEHIRISVLDTGEGIDEDLAKRLFGRFERSAGEDRRKVGTGIGLALVKQLVAGHGGTVEALRRPTGGTEFRVLLPASLSMDNIVAIGPVTLRTNHAPDPAATKLTTGTVFRPTGLSAGTIVVAEDNPKLAESVATMLSEHFTVIVALDGLAALEMVKQHQPQLLITDVEMPGMTGIELAAKFRELAQDRVAPVIILSAVNDLSTRVAGLEAGAIDYVTKPFDPAELRARVQAQFRMRDLAMRLHRAEQLSSMGILTSGLAHELRNPANGIVNALAPLSELLPPELIGPETDAGQLLDAMRSSADQIAFLVRQLLGFRNNGKAAIELRPAEVPPLIDRATRLAKDALAGVELKKSINLDRRAMCAAPLLVQVLANLVENAGHAAGRGGWVSITATQTNGRITIEVSDSGGGVPPELRERIFEPFFTTKSPGKGTGLGLSVARTIVHQHGGTLEIRDSNGRTAFVVDLKAESQLAAKASAV